MFDQRIATNAVASCNEGDFRGGERHVGEDSFVSTRSDQRLCDLSWVSNHQLQGVLASLQCCLGSWSLSTKTFNSSPGTGGVLHVPTGETEFEDGTYMELKLHPRSQVRKHHGRCTAVQFPDAEGPTTCCKDETAGSLESKLIPYLRVQQAPA